MPLIDLVTLRYKHLTIIKRKENKKIFVLHEIFCLLYLLSCSKKPNMRFLVYVCKDSHFLADASISFNVDSWNRTILALTLNLSFSLGAVSLSVSGLWWLFWRPRSLAVIHRVQGLLCLMV